MTPETLREIRTFLDLSQAQVAWLIGVDIRTWRRWERDEREIPEPVARLVVVALKYAEVRKELERLAATEVVELQDSKTCVDALLDPPEPTEALRKAAARHRSAVKSQ